MILSGFAEVGANITVHFLLFQDLNINYDPE